MSYRNIIKEGTPVSSITTTNLANIQPNRIYRKLPKFLFLIPLGEKYLPERCCCKLFTLRTTIILIALWDVISALFRLIRVLATQENTRHNMKELDAVWVFAIYAYTIIQMFALLPGIITLCYLRRRIFTKIKLYYYYKIAEFLALLFLFYIYFRIMESDIFWGVFYLFRLAYLLYFLLILFSYWSRVERGEEILVNDGREVVEMVANVYKDAASVPGVAISEGDEVIATSKVFSIHNEENIS